MIEIGTALFILIVVAVSFGVGRVSKEKEMEQTHRRTYSRKPPVYARRR